MKHTYVTGIIIVLSLSTVVFAEKPKDRETSEWTYIFLPQPKQVEYQKSFTKGPLDTLEKTIKIDPGKQTHSQGYELKISSREISIVAHDPAGVFYAEQTLRQITSQAGNQNIRRLTIRDWPDFPVRGVMLDISRDKVPTMETLFHLADMLSSWKINHFELYTEHTFAYKNHQPVWKDASPMTADQIQILDRYCKERFIDLVPNQNSFGHMERWLKHEEYRHLAEAPELVDTAWGKRKWHVLYPADEGSIQLVAELYDELLPNFSSHYFNVGCDETIELCNGRSKELCEKIGKEEVYLEFLLKIYAQVKKHHRIMMFWADILQSHPEMMSRLPKDIIALVWGYSADHPFKERCQTVSQTGCTYYVCPGNSTWLSIAGRTDNAMANLLNAAENGLKYSAGGYLITDWGDRGDWEPLPVSYLGFAYGSGLAWSVETNRDMDVAAMLNEFVFQDPSGTTGRLMFDLGNVYQKPGPIIHNSSVLARLMLYYDYDLNSQQMNDLTIERLEATKEYLEKMDAELQRVSMQTSDKNVVRLEIQHIINLLNHSCDLGIARLKAEGRKTENIPKTQRETLAADLEKIIENHKKVWLLRNRPGGLPDSLSYMYTLLDAYRK